MNAYPSSLSNSEWEILNTPLPPRSDTLRGRSEENSRRSIVDGILYILRAGGAWWMMPQRPAIIISGSGQSWDTGQKSMMPCGTRPAPPLEKKAPTAAIIDSQSVLTAYQPGPRGYDAARKITGRKRHVLADTCGFLLELKVTPADVQDRGGARMLQAVLMPAFGWLQIIWANSAYGAPLQDEVRSIPRHRKVKLEVVRRSDDVKGFKMLPKRWIVERTFG